MRRIVNGVPGVAAAIVLGLAAPAWAADGACPGAGEAVLAGTKAAALHGLLGRYETAVQRGQLAGCDRPAEGLRVVADALYQVGEYGKARRACDLLGTVLAGLKGEDLLRCAKPLAIRGDLAGARKLLDAFVAEGGAEPARRLRALTAVAGTLEGLSRYGAAADYLGQAVTAAPKDPALALRWVQDLLEAGRGPEAGRAADQVAKAFGAGSPATLRDLSLLLVRFRMAPRAKAVAALLAGTENPSIEDLDAVAMVCEATGDPEPARTAMERFSAAKGDAASLRDAATTLERHGLWALAADAVRRSAASGGDAEASLRLGRLLLRAGQPAEAERSFKEFLASPQAREGAERQVADEWSKARMPDRAAAVLREGLAKHGWDSPELVLALGKALAEAGDSAGEAAAYQEAAGKAREPGRLWLRVGDALLARGLAKRAKEAYSSAAGAGKDPVVRALAAAGMADVVLTEDRSHRDVAERELLSALEIAGDRPEVLERVERVAARVGEARALSLAVLERAVQRDPGNPEVWRKLARASGEAGKRAQAAAAWRSFVRTSKDQEAALAEAVGALLQARRVPDALGLLESEDGKRGRVSPALARLMGNACLDAGDRGCASRFLDVFLAGPMALDFDYLALGTRLTKAGLWDTAARALAAAAKAGPVDRMWEVEVAEGRLDLARGKAGDADGHFLKAWEAGPQKRALLVRIAGEYVGSGHLTAALAWWKRGIEDGDAATQIAAFPGYTDTLWRMGRKDDLKAAARNAAGVAWRALQPLRGVAVNLAAAGLSGEAATLVLGALGGLSDRDSDAAEDLVLALLLRAGRQDEAIRRVETTCRTDDGDRDARCAAGARRLAGAGRPDAAIRLLGDRARDAEAGAPVLLELAGLQLRRGERGPALEAAARAADRVRSPADLIARLGPLLSDLHLWDPYLGVLQRLLARPAFAADGVLLLEMGRVQLGQGNVEGAMLAFQGYMGGGRGGEIRVYRELARAGLRDRAVSVLLGASPVSTAAFEPSDLQEVFEDLLHFGRREVVMQIVERYRLGNDEIASAEEALGRVLENLAMHREAAEALAKVPDRRLGGEGRLALVRALWSLGRRADAVAAARRGAPERVEGGTSRTESGLEEWAQGVVELFASEGAATEAREFLDALAAKRELPAGARMVRARWLAQAGADAAARDLLAGALEDAGDSVPDEALEVIRSEVRAGRGAALARTLAGARGRTAAAAALLAACLAGTKDVADSARTALEADGLSPALALEATAWFQCGRWREAADAALRGLEVLPADASPEPLARLATVAGRMAGKDPVPGLVKLLTARSEDRIAVLSWVAAVRQSAGDLAGAAAALGERARMAVQDPGVQLAALDSALWAGDDKVRAEAEARLMAGTEDRAGTALKLHDVYQRALRDDLALGMVAAAKALSPADPLVNWRAFVAAARDGRSALDEAAAYVAGDGEPRAAAGAVVATGASQLAEAVVGKYLGPATVGPPSQDAAMALVQAALLNFRTGRADEGRGLVRRAVDLARDPEEIVSAVGQAAVVDAAVPVDAVQDALDRIPEARREALARLPYPAAAQCLAAVRDRASAEACGRGIAARQYLVVPLLVAGANRALAERRWDAAEALYRETVRQVGTGGVRVHVANQIVTTLGSGGEKDLAVRRRFGVLVEELAGATWDRDQDTWGLKAHSLEMSQGKGAGASLYRARIAANPADSSLRNNVAYLLSISGGDLDDALESVRAAEVLGWSGLPYYLETEAWIRFLDGNAKEAEKTMARARRLWRMEQGGGLAEGFHHLGRILEGLGRKADAREAYRRAVTFEPTEWTGQRSLERWRALGPGEGRM